MRPRRNCGQVYHISRGRMRCLIEYGICSLFLRYIYGRVDSSNRMKPIRSLVWRVNANCNNVSTPFIMLIYLLPYEHYGTHMNAKVASLPV